jgi:hypothetical protein
LCLLVWSRLYYKGVCGIRHGAMCCCGACQRGESRRSEGVLIALCEAKPTKAYIEGR